MQSLNRYPYHLNEFNNKDINSFVVILIFLKLLLSCPVGMGIGLTFWELKGFFRRRIHIQSPNIATIGRAHQRERDSRDSLHLKHWL